MREANLKVKGKDNCQNIKLKRVLAPETEFYDVLTVKKGYNIRKSKETIIKPEEINRLGSMRYKHLLKTISEQAMTKVVLKMTCLTRKI